uniref:DUF4283 domain-containing protein n=1 Tax=Cannabis sativa TaxID=3483 RepID=A0A803Q892_CANSA
MANLPTSQSTHLTPEEALVHDFDHVSIHPEPQSQSHCLVVKILSPKTLKVDWIQKAMNEAWVARCPFSFSEYHSGLFLVQFGCEGDRRRVMEGQPWHFDRSLMIFAIPDGFDTILPSQLRYIPLWVQVNFIPFGSRSYGLAQFVADAIGDLIESQTVHSTLHCSLPTHPIMTSTTLPTTSKGKAPMYPQPSLVSLSSPPLSSLHINDSPAILSSTRKRSFARQTCQVGSSVRSMLKRARASHSDFVVVPSMSDNEETAGVAQQPRREK